MHLTLAYLGGMGVSGLMLRLSRAATSRVDVGSESLTLRTFWCDSELAPAAIPEPGRAHLPFPSSRPLNMLNSFDTWIAKALASRRKSQQARAPYWLP